MLSTIEKALKTTIENWEKMKMSKEEQAEVEANQFEASFYELIEQIRQWVRKLKAKPVSLDEALSLPEIGEIIHKLPAEIYLNFETELDYIIEGVAREEDAKYD